MTQVLSRSLTIDRKLLFLLFFPLLLTLLNSGWMFLENGWIDPWVYFGFSLDLKHHLQAFGNTYYASRLSWILPNFLSYKFLPISLAPYILHLTFYYAAITSLYLILKHHFSSRVALLTALLLSCDGYFLRSIGSNYTDGAGLTYFLLSLLMLTYGAKQPASSRWLFLAGLSYSAMLYTHIFLLALSPFLLLYYLFAHPRSQPLKDLKNFFFGFLTLSLLFCSINYSINHSFPSVQSNVATSASLLLHNAWWRPLSEWWKAAFWLLLPILTTLAALLLLSIRRLTSALPHPSSIRFFQAFFLLHILLFAVLQFGLKLHVLSILYYASFLIPSTFLALGSLLACTIDRISRTHFYALIATITTAALCIYTVPIRTYWLLPILLFAAGLVCLFTRAKSLALYSIACSLPLATLVSVNPSSYRSRTFEKDSFFAVIKSIRTIQQLSLYCASRFWYDASDPLGDTFRSVSSSYLWGFRLINESFPIPSALHFSPPALNDIICLLSNLDNPMQEANQGLAQIHLQGELLSEQLIHHNSVHYKMTFFKVRECTP